MRRLEVDRACSQTPCLCGDSETWHPECFVGMTPGRVRDAYDRAYKIARSNLRKRVGKSVQLLVELVNMP